ncbi:MAG: cytochrome-c peroxidase [Flavobacteriales bacterium]|nr:cytochrome-c peroxidase [Flavobacteriales bacterium]
MQQHRLNSGCIFEEVQLSYRHIAWVFAVIAAAGCRPDPPEKNPPPFATADFLQVPEGWDGPDFPEDNGFNDVRWVLGKDLFFDERLSIDGAVSCATCHLPSRAFSAPEAITPGAFGALGERNAATLTNAAYQPHFMSEGGVPTLEMQVLVPLQEPSEMAHNIVTVCEELAEDYAVQADAAYGRALDPFVMTRALATFQRTLISGNALWDRWQRNEVLASESEQRGADLFGAGGLGCDRCHQPPLFTTHGFANNGLDAVSIDPGRWRLTGEPSDSGAFKIPTLRNIGFTSPYMHDGRFGTLDEVLDHYASGGAGHAHQDSLLTAVELSTQDRSDLLAFLAALNDTAFVDDLRWTP